MEEFTDWVSGVWEFDGKEFEHDPMKMVMVNDELIPAYELIEMEREQAEEISFNNKVGLLRKIRDKLIANTDWWVLPDRNPTAEQLEYRQKLRDITTTVNQWSDFETFTWPVKP